MEIPMITRLMIASRLICFGSAKARTNISVGPVAEDNPELGFEE